MKLLVTILAVFTFMSQIINADLQGFTNDRRIMKKAKKTKQPKAVINQYQIVVENGLSPILGVTLCVPLYDPNTWRPIFTHYSTAVEPTVAIFTCDAQGIPKELFIGPNEKALQPTNEKIVGNTAIWTYTIDGNTKRVQAEFKVVAKNNTGGAIVVTLTLTGPKKVTWSVPARDKKLSETVPFFSTNDVITVTDDKGNPLPFVRYPYLLYKFPYFMIEITVNPPPVAPTPIAPVNPAKPLKSTKKIEMKKPKKGKSKSKSPKPSTKPSAKPSHKPSSSAKPSHKPSPM
jgi:hypothetical protein